MSGFEVDADLVRTLAKLLDETGLGELEYEIEGHRIRVARPSGGVSTAVQVPVAQSVAPTDGSAAGTSDDASRPPDDALGTVTSPMVGTIYLSPTPDDPPFVGPGDTVAAGQTVMLIEAMKTFNEIKATSAGRVTSVLVTTGQPVEYGEPLLVIQ